MNFEDIAAPVREKFSKLLDDHLKASAKNLEEDKCILPVLAIYGKTPAENTIVSLQPKDGNTDVDKALNVALNMLKTTDFAYALFSYSTVIGLNDGSETEAIKTLIIAENGLSVVFFTPYKFKGIFKKKVCYEKSLIGNVVENILE